MFTAFIDAESSRHASSRHASLHQSNLSVDGENKKSRCTAESIKSCFKLFCAHLFSHVGLCGLVVGYSIIGAFIFKYLEEGNEKEIREKGGSTRKETLDELYNITGMYT